MTVPSDSVSQLVEKIEQRLNRNDLFVSIRTEDRKYVFVNDVWLRAAGGGLTSEDVIGNRLSDLDFLPKAEIQHFEEMDDRLLQQRWVMDSTVYTVGEIPHRVMTVRVKLSYQGANYIVVVTFTVTYRESNMWHSDNAFRVFGEDIAKSLLRLDDSNDEAS